MDPNQILQEQSDLGPHCLSTTFKYFSGRQNIKVTAFTESKKFYYMLFDICQNV